MLKFGSTGITAGYIKQLLATFQLPKMAVYTQEHERFFEANGYESPFLMETFTHDYASQVNTIPDTSAITIYRGTGTDREALTLKQVEQECYMPYLKDGMIQFYTAGYYNTRLKSFVPGKWQTTPLNVTTVKGGANIMYERGMRILNNTKTLQIKNNIYDSYTHEYLGDYLRFLRDYDGINLMPLYNCFSNQRPHLLKFVNNVIELNATDENYKVYSLPVRLFNNYTIAIDSDYPVEVCCGIYTDKGILETPPGMKFDITTQTYKRYSKMQFGAPILYTALTDLAVPRLSVEDSTVESLIDHANKRSYIAWLTTHQSDLRMFIKVSKHTESSITVLEGDYRNWNDYTAHPGKPEAGIPCDCGVNKKVNHTVISNESIFADADIKLITSLQLLKFNTGNHRPFADRLLEYLLDQVITGGERETRENVLMAQTLAGLRHDGKSNYSTLQTVKTPNLTEGQNGNWFLDGYADTKIPMSKIKTPLVVAVSCPATETPLYCWGLQGAEMTSGPESNPATEVTVGSLTCPADCPHRNYCTRIVVDTEDKVYYKRDILPLNYNIRNGIWSPALQRIFYRYMSTQADFTTTPDILGYVDKDVESRFEAHTLDKKGNPITKTMLSFNAWEDIKE